MKKKCMFLSLSAAALTSSLFAGPRINPALNSLPLPKGSSLFLQESVKFFPQDPEFLHDHL